MAALGAGAGGVGTTDHTMRGAGGARAHAAPATAVHRTAALAGLRPYFERGPRLVPGVGGTASTLQGYSPAQMWVNYNMYPLYKAGINGRGRTIGLVDVYGSPTIRHDLATFDARFDLPAPPSFKIIEPAGKVPAFNAKNLEMQGWAGETTLDVEWAHAMAPGASIVLAVTGVDEVEGTSGVPQIMAAENYLIRYEHVAVISQSFGATEETFPSADSLMDLRGVYGEAERHGVTILAAAGDAGASGQTTNVNNYYGTPVVSWPASDPLVTAVGGTELFIDSAGHPTDPPAVWNAAAAAGGGGVSEFFARPSWQDGVASTVGSRRGMPDVAMTAYGTVIYTSVPGSPAGFYATAGTSLSSPMFAGIVAVAAQLRNGALGLINPTLYVLGAIGAPGLIDVTHGNNSVLVPVNGKESLVKGYEAVRGYDLASGWGTVNGTELVQELAGRSIPA
jgi:subtilase family serine protease